MKNKPTEDKVEVPYTYDTPTGIIEKEGRMLRGMATHDPKRPLILRIAIIIFSFLMLVGPGIGLLFLAYLNIAEVESYQLIYGVALGLLMTLAGLTAIYQNVRR